MKQLFFAILVLLSTNTFSQTATDTLNNESVIKLSKNKLPESVILKKISQSVCIFDLSVEALVKLKENEVNDRVISAMIDQQRLPVRSADINKAAVKSNANEQAPAFPESGIYFSRDADYINLDPSIVVPIDPGNYVFSVKFKFKIDGPEANYQIENKRPEFYFVFDTVIKSLNDPNTKTLVQDNYFYIDPLFPNAELSQRNRIYQAISPNDFRLLKLELDKGKSKREFAAKRIGLLDEKDVTIDKKYTVSFKYEKISGTTFKIKFDRDLLPGEYCFFYSGNNSITDCIEQNRPNTMKAFDFSIK